MSDIGRELEGLNVLLVDDDQDTRELLSEFLEQSGAHVVSASCAADGLAALDCAVPAIIVSDIGMPEMNGYDFMRAIRERAPDKGGSTKAVALTAFNSQEDRRCALEAGFQMHLCKPIELNALASVLVNVSRQPGSVDAPTHSP